MRCGMIYKWWKEGKIAWTKEQMNDVWRIFENLNPYCYKDRLMADEYT